MSEDKEKKLEKCFIILEQRGGHLVTPMRDYYGRPEEIFSNYESIEEAEKDILERGETFHDYIVVPSYRVTNY